MSNIPSNKTPAHEPPPARPRWFTPAAFCVAILVVALRLFQLDTLQNELYGDIELDHFRFERVLTGQWPFDFVLSVGPLYHYLVTPIVAVIGTSYASLKLTTVIVSLGIVLATFAFSRRLLNDTFALLAVAVAGISSWLLIWSRLGNSPVVVPLLTTTALWLMLRFVQGGRRIDGIACGVVSALGFYAFPQGFVISGVVLATLACMRWAGHPIPWRNLGLIALTSSVCALPFVWLVWNNPVTFTTGYVGSKFITSENPFGVLLRNLASGALAFHVHGDTNFRANPLGVPHLDPLSGVLFLAGVVFWLRGERRRWSPALLVPFVLLQAPSLLVLGRPEEVPSATRALGVAPLAYILVASGIWWLGSILRTAGRPRAAVASGLVLLAVLLGLNTQRYFDTYINGLPYHNTSISAEIAAYADRLAPETQVYLAGCCWEASMPETPFVKLVVKRPQNLHELDPAVLSCGTLRDLQQPAVLIWSFKDALPTPNLSSCPQFLPGQLFHSLSGWPVFHVAPLVLDPASAAANEQSPLPAETAQQLVPDVAVYQGQPVAVRISPLDMGTVADLFDQDATTLVRGRDANPLLVELRFDQPRIVRIVGLDLTTMPLVRLTVELYAGTTQVASVTQAYDALPPDPHVDLALPADAQAASLILISIEDLREKPPEGYHVHLRGIQLR